MKIALFIRALPVIGVVVLAIQLAVWLPTHANRTDTAGLDFPPYYAAAVHLTQGASIYTGEFLYPPTFAALIRPAALLSAPTFQRIWYVLLLAAFWAYAWGLARLAFRPSTWRHVLGAGIVLLLTPGAKITMSFGNADVFVWALVAWGLAEESELALLVGTALKVYPAAGLLVLAVRRRTIGRVALATVASLGLAFAVVGARPFIDWWHTGGAPLPRTNMFSPKNASLSVLVLRLLRCSDPLSPLAFQVFRLVPLAVVALTLWLTRRWTIRAQAVAAILSTAWAAPVCWWYRLPLGLVGLAVWWRERGDLEPSDSPA